MNRLIRRQRILRGKRSGCFDTNQRYLEEAVRARAARQVRVFLRRNQTVLLITPRWSRPDRFLDELAADVGIGSPQVFAHVVPLGVLSGRKVHEVWSFLLRALVEVCEVPLERTAAQPMHREGFRQVVGEILDASVGGPMRALLLYGIEHLPFEVRSDAYRALMDHHDRVGSARRVNMLFAGTVAGSNAEFAGARKVVLPDFGPAESVQALYEYVSNVEARDVEIAASMVGGVPALLHAVGMHGETEGEMIQSQDELWRILGPLADELRGAVDIVAADDKLAERLEDVAREGTLRVAPKMDGKLLRAGLLRGVPRASRPRVTVRAPIIAQLAGMALGQGDGAGTEPNAS